MSRSLLCIIFIKTGIQSVWKITTNNNKLPFFLNLYSIEDLMHLDKTRTHQLLSISFTFLQNDIKKAQNIEISIWNPFQELKWLWFWKNRFNLDLVCSYTRWSANMWATTCSKNKFMFSNALKGVNPVNKNRQKKFKTYIDVRSFYEGDHETWKFRADFRRTALWLGNVFCCLCSIWVK